MDLTITTDVIVGAFAGHRLCSNLPATIHNHFSRFRTVYDNSERCNLIFFRTCMFPCFGKQDFSYRRSREVLRYNFFHWNPRNNRTKSSWVTKNGKFHVRCISNHEQINIYIYIHRKNLVNESRVDTISFETTLSLIFIFYIWKISKVIRTGIFISLTHFFLFKLVIKENQQDYHSFISKVIHVDVSWEREILVWKHSCRTNMLWNT